MNVLSPSSIFVGNKGLYQFEIECIPYKVRLTGQHTKLFMDLIGTIQIKIFMFRNLCFNILMLKTYRVRIIKDQEK